MVLKTYKINKKIKIKTIKKTAKQFEISYKKTLEELGYGKNKKEEEKEEKVVEPQKNEVKDN